MGVRGIETRQKQRNISLWWELEREGKARPSVVVMSKRGGTDSQYVLKGDPMRLNLLGI